MSQTSKVVLGIFAVIVVAGGIWWYMSGNQAGNQNNVPTGSSNPPAASPTPAAAPSPSPAAASGQTGVSAQSNSDASLNQDLSSFDSQLNGMNSDSASIDQGLNDTPIPQN